MFKETSEYLRSRVQLWLEKEFLYIYWVAQSNFILPRVDIEIVRKRFIFGLVRSIVDRDKMCCSLASRNFYLAL